MNNTATLAIEPEEIAPASLKLHFPFGLLGFESIEHFVLISDPAEAPFSWLQVENDPSLAFIVCSPFEILPTYAPDIPAEDVASLGLAGPDDVSLLCIVTLQPDGRATANLKGPVVINRHTAKAKQVVLANAAHYPLQHPLPVAGR